MYIHSTFPPDGYYTRQQLHEQWLEEANNCFRLGREFQGNACLQIANSYKD